MKNGLLTLVCALFVLPLALQAQKVLPTELYPSNLEENMYYDKYDNSTKQITGICFMVLSDGNNSKDKTPPFKVKLYLLVPGSEEPIYVKTYETEGIWHMGSIEYKNETVDLSEVEGLQPGTYRLGVYIDADNEIKEPNEGNNAMLFQGEINFTSGSAKKAPPQKKGTPKKEEPKDEWGEEPAPGSESDELNYNPPPTKKTTVKASSQTKAPAQQAPAKSAPAKSTSAKQEPAKTATKKAPEKKSAQPAKKPEQSTKSKVPTKEDLKKGLDKMKEGIDNF